MNHEDLKVHQDVFASLIEARQLASSNDVDIWQYAIDANYLRGLGARTTDLRIWEADELIQHGVETTPDGAKRRTFRGIARMQSQEKRSSFVLTELGVMALRGAGMMPFENGTKPSIRPTWCPESGELRYAGQLVKQYRWDAPNQLQLLQAFQDQGWPEQIPGVFPVNSKVNYKRRLHDTIKCLNRRQNRSLIRFHGDGTGNGVEWRRYDPKTANLAGSIPGSAKEQHNSLTLGRQ